MLPLPFSLENDTQNVAQKQSANEKCRLWEGQFKPILIIVKDTSLGLESPQIFWGFPKKLSEVKVAQSCLTLCDPMNYSPPGSSVHEIFQAKVLEGGAIAFSAIEYYSAIKKNEIMPFAATWMDLEIIILSEVSQRKTNTIWYHLHVEFKICHEWTYLQNRNRLTDIKNKLMVTKWERGRNKLGVWDSLIYTAAAAKSLQSCPTLCRIP